MNSTTRIYQKWTFDPDPAVLRERMKDLHYDFSLKSDGEDTSRNRKRASEKRVAENFALCDRYDRQYYDPFRGRVALPCLKDYNVIEEEE